jgi:hypothetical protein
MGIVRDLYYARKMSAGLKLPAPTVALLIKRMFLASTKERGELKTVSGAMVHITDALAKAATSVLASIEPIQAGSGDPSPDNVRPISGRTGLSVYRTGKNLLGINRAEGTPSPASVIVSPRVLATDKLFAGLRADNYYYHGYVTNYSVTDSTIKVTTANNVNYGVAFPVACHGNTAYTLSATLTGCNMSVGSYDADWNFIKRVTNTSPTTPVTFTTPANAAYITIIFGSSTLGTEGTATNIQLELGSPATTYEPYNGNTYSVDWTAEAGTVYGGTLDVVTGELTVTHAIEDLGNVKWKKDNSRAGVFYGSVTGRETNSYVLACSDYLVLNQSVSTEVDMYISGHFSYGGNTIFVRDTRFSASTAAEYKTGAAGIKAVYKLTAPLTYQLTAQEVQMLLGENYIWSSSGDSVSVTYLAEGNANNRQALRILLGDNYSNPGTPDDASDKEALDILLGR